MPQLRRFQNGASELAREKPAHSSIEGLGTWGARQQVFLGRSERLDEDSAGTDGEAEEEPVSASPTLHFADEAGGLRPTLFVSTSRQVDESEEEERQAAWR